MGYRQLITITTVLFLFHQLSCHEESHSSSSTTSSTSPEDSSYRNYRKSEKLSARINRLDKPSRRYEPSTLVDKIAAAMAPKLGTLLDVDIPIPDQSRDDKSSMNSLKLTQGEISRLYTIYELRTSLFKVGDPAVYELHFSFDIPTIKYFFEYSMTKLGITIERKGNLFMHLEGRNVATLLARVPREVQEKRDVPKRGCVMTVKAVEMTAIGYPSVRRMEYNSIFRTGLTRATVLGMVRHMKKKLLNEVRAVLEKTIDSAVRKHPLVCSESETSVEVE